MRLIDADALSKTIDNIDWYCKARGGILVSGAPSTNKVYFKATDIYEAIDNAPTVEPKKDEIRWTDKVTSEILTVISMERISERDRR